MVPILENKLTQKSQVNDKIKANCFDLLPLNKQIELADELEKRSSFNKELRDKILTSS